MLQKTKTRTSRVIFFCRNPLTGPAATQKDQLDKIVRGERKQNEFGQLSGFLIVDRQFLLHIIEGDSSAVYEAMQRIFTAEHVQEIKICEWKEIGRRDFVTSLEVSVRGRENEAIFVRHGLSEMLERGTPKPALLLETALALQADGLGRQGIKGMLLAH